MILYGRGSMFRPQFLELICPKAESIRDEIANRANLSGAFNYWQMVIDLRLYAFQSGAAIFQKCPQIRPLLTSRILQHRRSELDAIYLPFRAFIAPGRMRSFPSAGVFELLLHFDEQMEETGTYHTLDANESNSIHAFINASPKSPDVPRAPTQVDLVLPPTEGFYKLG
ncbi:hypothetical protein B0H14DRAFT_2622299 [Mycena olivaceomarginata]|nr:hypothetical protein B0H14DRAFT_2622299 [Mycena olivaceomarginata]